MGVGFWDFRILGPCFGVLRLSSGSGFGVKVWGFKTPAKLKTSEYLGVSETEDPPHPPHMKNVFDVRIPEGILIHIHIVLTDIYTHISTYLPTPTYMHTYIHTYIHNYVHTYIHPCMHT